MTFETKLYVGIYGTILALALSAWILFSFMEMRAFNRHSEKDVQLIDAMFVQLRIQD